MKYFYAFLFVFPSLFQTQILERYPQGQTDYVGGNAQFFKDFHKIVTEKKMQPCENKDEYYNFRIVVYPDATIKYVKDEDPAMAEKNKCAFDLTRNVAKYMKGWNPATENGQKVAALTSFWIFPDDLFENYKEGYDSSELISSAEFKGGFNELRKKIANRIDLNGFNANGRFTLVATFVVNTEGKIEDVKLAESTPNEDFNRMIISAIKSIKDPWVPAKHRNITLRSHYKLPLAFQF